MIAKTSTVCIYGRRGTGGSDPLPIDSVRTVRDQVEDLDGLITELDLETPVILVGHSLGGWNIRVYTDEYPERVAGLVLVDATHPDMVELEGFVQPPHLYEWLDEVASADQVRATGDLGGLPIYVLTASESIASIGTWEAFQEDLAALSTDTRHKIVTSGHHIALHNPAAIEAAVRSVVKRIG
jgi:pimeloyl-ACP methyl ester carboxylesterase